MTIVGTLGFTLGTCLPPLQYRQIQGYHWPRTFSFVQGCVGYVIATHVYDTTPENVQVVLLIGLFTVILVVKMLQDEDRQPRYFRD